jgi:hypothetical protein
MIDDNMFVSQAAERIVTARTVDLSLVLIFIAHAEAHVPDYDVVPPDLYRVVGNADAVTGCRLTGNGHIAGNDQL